MADNNITFKIGTVFSGEGFKKARTEVADMNQNMKKGVAAASQMAGALGGLDASASKAMTAMTGMLQSLLTFNATAIISQAAMIGISLWTQKMNEEAAALTERMNKLKESCEKAFNTALSDRMSSISAEVKSISAGFESMTKQAIAFTAALEGVRASNAAGGIAQLQVDKLNKMLEAHSEAERVNIEQAYNLKIAQAKLIEAEQAGAEKVNAATEVYELNKKRVANIDEQLAALGEERRSLEQNMIAAKASDDKHWHDIQAKVNALKDQEAALLEKRNETEANNDVLELKIQQAKKESENAILNATATVKEAELAEKKLSEAKHERAVKEAAAKDAAELKAAADIIDAKETESAADIQKKANDAAKALAHAQIDYTNKLQKFNAFDLIAEAARNMVGQSGIKGTGLLKVDVQKSIQTQTADAKVNEAIRNGAINTVKDADRLQRQAMREARDAISKNQGQQIREAQRYKRLSEMNPKALCSADRAFMQKYEKIIAASEKRKKDLAEAKKSVDESKKAQEESAKNLKDIKTILGKLGLK